MRRTLSAVTGVVVATAVSMIVLVPAGAQPAPGAPPPTRVEGLCAKVPELQSVVEAARQADAANLDALAAAVASQRAAMTAAITELASAVVAHLGALDAGGNTGATGSVLKGKQARYVDSVVSWSRARKQAFDSEQMLVFRDLQKTLLDSVHGSACA